MAGVFVSIAIIVASLLLMAATLHAAARATRAGRLSPEAGRKAVHVGLGLYCLSFPWLFAQVWEVAAACGAGIALLLLARRRLRRTLGDGLHAVRRRSPGDVLFALAVAFLFVLRQLGATTGLENALYLLPLSVLTISDAAAALVGVRFGRRSFLVGDETKSWEGVGAFIASAWVVAVPILMLAAGMSAGEAVLVGLAAAVCGAALEAVGTRGLDNLAIPVGLYVVVLVATGGEETSWAALAGFAAAGALVLVLLARPRARPRLKIAMRTVRAARARRRAAGAWS